MTKRNNIIWKVIKTVCWVIFFLYCMKTLDLIVSYSYSLYNPADAKDLYHGLDLSQLYFSNKLHYSLTVLVIIIISALKALVFYFATTLFKILNFVKPFSRDISRIITKITYYTFAIGIVSGIVEIFVNRLSANGYNFSPIESLWGDGDAYFFMSAILFVIALIFKKGIELQSENELTV